VDTEALRNKLSSMDKGRFAELFAVVNFKDVCFECAHLNTTLPITQQYRCKVAPACPAATLSTHLISYLLWQLAMKTERQHLAFLDLKKRNK